MIDAPSGGTTFPTAIGICGMTWTPQGIHTVHLPEAKPATLRALVAANTTGAMTRLDDAPESIRTIAARINAQTRGADDDLANIPLDEAHLSSFASKIYLTLRGVGPGDTITYGELAHRAGSHGANSPRAVGQVLGRNPYPLIVPCHRVIAANGAIGGFSAHGGAVTKIRLLRAEARGAASALMPWDLDAAHRTLRKADPDIARLIKLVGHHQPTMRASTSTVAALAESITAQQVSTHAASSIFARLSLLFPRPLYGPTASGIARLGDDALRQAGLSASKVAALRDLSQRALAGQIPDLDELSSRTDDEVIAALTPVRGIGKWTVEMLLIFRLGRPDVLPVDDFAVRKGFANLTGQDNVTAKELAHRGDAWKPWRSVVSWYLWRASELGAAAGPDAIR